MRNQTSENSERDDAMNPVTPSKQMTAEQVNKAVANYRAMLEKHCVEFPADAVQKALGQPELATEQFAVFRTRVEAVSSMIIRRVKVDRSRTPQEVIGATGRVQYIDQAVLATMPDGEGNEVDVCFVPTKRRVPAAEVPAFLAKYGLVPDPRAQVAVNEADPAFADKYPNATQWNDNCYLTFRRWFDGRDVHCRRSDGDWDDDWFLSGVPASRK